MPTPVPRSPAIFEIDHLPNRAIRHDGRDYLFFSGTSYLGMAQNRRMQALLVEGMARYGLQFGSSRNGNLQLSIYDEFETILSKWVSIGRSALTVSSGMLAGQIVVDWLANELGPAAVGFQAPGTHPALWHPLLKPHIMPLVADDMLAMLAQTPALSPVYVLTNSVDAIRSVYYDFSWLRNIRDRPVWVVVDDSHGLGVLNGGRGIGPELDEWIVNTMPNVQLIVTASLAKAMGLPGGVVFSDPDTLATLRRTAYFGACSPMPPAYAYAYLESDWQYRQAYEQLTKNVALAEKLLCPSGLFSHAPGYPVFYTEHDELALYLLEKGIFIYSFAYPTAADKANTRIVISALHQPEDLIELARHVNEFARLR